MKPLLTLLITLGVTLTSYGVGNQVLKDLKQLNTAGVSLEIKEEKATALVSVRVQVPREFNTGKATGVKPFSSISFIQTNEKVALGPGLIGAPASRFPLAYETLNNGERQTQITIKRSDIENGYIAVAYAHNNKSRSITTIVHIPLAKFLKH